MPAARATPLWRKLIPYLGTLAIFALILLAHPDFARSSRRCPQVPVLDFLAVFMPYSLFYCAIHSGVPHLGRAPLQRAHALSRHPADPREHVRAGL